MKALTLTQPWATLMCLGLKTFETRSWPTNYRGPVAIHSAKAFPVWAREVFLQYPFIGALYPNGYKNARDLPLGKILCIVSINNVRKTEFISQSMIGWQEYAYGDFSRGRYAFETSFIYKFDNPIPATGSLGLWNFDEMRIPEKERKCLLAALMPQLPQ